MVEMANEFGNYIQFRQTLAKNNRFNNLITNGDKNDVTMNYLYEKIFRFCHSTNDYHIR